MRYLTTVLAVTATLILSTAPANADIGDQLFKLLADDGVAFDYFGASVAISDTTAIIGAVWDDDNGTNSGSAYLFDITTGKLIAKLLADDGEDGDTFGISVSICGTIAIVGAYRDEDNGSQSGSVYLFDTTTGQQLSKLLPTDGQEGDGFGRYLATSGTIGNEIAIIAAPGDDDNGNDSGSAYIFDISDPTNPTQIVKLLADDGTFGDIFGFSVDISGISGNEIAIVGASGDDDNGSLSGSTYLFDANTGKQIAKFLPSDGTEMDLFGSSIAMSGDIAIVGARGDDDNGNSSGSAYLFDISDAANPMQIAKLLAEDGEEFDSFGYSVSISGLPGKEVAIVGAVGDADSGALSGSAYLFNTTTGQQIAKLLSDDGAADDLFGISVAISGTIAIVAARQDDDNGEDSGSVYIFDASMDQPCPWDLDNSGSVGTSDLLELLSQWGTNGSADFDGDGFVGKVDLIVLLANWGPCE